MNPEEYIKERVDDQFNWMESKSARSQKKYKRIKILVIVFSVMIPFLTGLMDKWDNMFDYIQVSIGVLGVAVAISEGILSLNKYQDNWLNYRATAEALKREKLMYQTGVGKYAAGEKESFPHFVMAIESILKDENAKWIEYIGKEEGENA